MVLKMRYSFQVQMLEKRSEGDKSEGEKKKRAQTSRSSGNTSLLLLDVDLALLALFFKTNLTPLKKKKSINKIKNRNQTPKTTQTSPQKKDNTTTNHQHQPLLSQSVVIRPRGLSHFFLSFGESVEGGDGGSRTSETPATLLYE